MTRTQVQLPDSLYRRTKAFADEREVSMAEVFRHAVELYIVVHSKGEEMSLPGEWSCPVVKGHRVVKDPFADPDWRAKLYEADGEEVMAR